MKKIPVLGDLQQTSDLLLWYFHRSWSERNLPGSANLSGGGSRVFDALASHELHQSLRTPKHRRACLRAQVVELVLGRLSVESRNLLSQSYCSFGAGRASYLLLEAANWRGACLLPLLIAQLKSAKPQPQNPVQTLEALVQTGALESAIVAAQSKLIQLLRDFKSELDCVLRQLHQKADRVTASAYQEAVNFVEH